eukprot:jgi/Astpho2/6189/Aster-03599
MHTSLPGLGQRTSLVHSNADLRLPRVAGSTSALQRASVAHHLKHLASGVCAASGRDDALRSMQEMRQGVSARLAEHEQELKSGSGPASRMRTRAAAGQTTSSLQEIDSDNYDQVLKDAGDKLVVIDFYTQWCGPCKVMLPMLEQLQEEQPDIRLYKLDCNKKNKQLGQSLGVKVAPTFHLMKNGNKVAEMTGAKIDELKKLIETHK